MLCVTLDKTFNLFMLQLSAKVDNNKYYLIALLSQRRESLYLESILEVIWLYIRIRESDY